MPNYLIKNTARDAHTKSLRAKQRLRGYPAKRTLRIGTVKVAPKKSRRISEHMFGMWFRQMDQAAQSGQCEVWELDENGHPICRVLPAPEAKLQGRPLISRGSPQGAVSTDSPPELEKVDELDKEHGDGDEGLTYVASVEGDPEKQDPDANAAVGPELEAEAPSVDEELGQPEGEHAENAALLEMAEEVVEETVEEEAASDEPSDETDKNEDAPKTEAEVIADLMDHSNKELHEILTTNGVKFNRNDNKSDLVAKFVAARAD